MEITSANGAMVETIVNQIWSDCGGAAIDIDSGANWVAATSLRSCAVLGLRNDDGKMVFHRFVSFTDKFDGDFGEWEVIWRSDETP